MRHDQESWSPERTERLRTMLANGASAGEAAKVLKITRNAVISKAHRSKFALKAPNTGRPHEDGVKPKPKSKAFNPERAQFRPKAPTKPQPAPPVRREPLPSLHLPLLELRTGDCRWPEGDGPFTFCAQPALQLGPYCMLHARIAFQPVHERRRDRTTDA